MGAEQREEKETEGRKKVLMDPWDTHTHTPMPTMDVEHIFMRVASASNSLSSSTNSNIIN